jgi:NADH-quinone oxidoreductase subunit G
MPKLTLDGREIEAAAGATILQAALGQGQEIPHFCYHPGLSIAGNCRICLVEVEKAPKLLIACQTQVQDGMIVRTTTPRVETARNAVMEFLLINHPLDCPICDQAGECRLQDNAVEHGAGTSRYTEPKLALAKAVDIGEHVLLDQERCIQCSRCVRFCDEVTQTGELAFFQRGERTVIGIWPGKRLDNPYSGNVVDICPVGALTLKEFRFRTRVWYLKNTPSICSGCARGCNVMIATGRQQELMTTRGQQDDRIKRLVPRVNLEVNGHWMCDVGRLSFLRLEAAPRLVEAEQDESAVDYDIVVREAADRLRAAAGAGRAAILAGPRSTCETLYAWRRLGAALGSPTLAVRRLERGQDDEILLRRDKGANSRGAEWIVGPGASEASLIAAAEGGRLDALVVLGDALDPEDTAPVSDALRSRVQTVIYVGPFRDHAARAASLRLPAAAWSEEDGTIVNFEGRIQQLRRARLPAGAARPAWRIAVDLAEAAGVAIGSWGAAADVLAAAAGEVRELGRLRETEIGLLGVAGA